VVLDAQKLANCLYLFEEAWEKPELGEQPMTFLCADCLLEKATLGAQAPEAQTIKIENKLCLHACMQHFYHSLSFALLGHPRLSQGSLFQGGSLHCTHCIKEDHLLFPDKYPI
jgi:hypothetical protein